MTIDDFVNGLFDLKYDKHPGVATKKYLIKCDADFIEQPKGSQNFPDFDPVENIFKEGKCCFRIEEKSNKKHGIHVKPMYNGHFVKKEDDALYTYITPDFSVAFLGEHISKIDDYIIWLEYIKKSKKLVNEFIPKFGGLLVPYFRATVTHKKGIEFCYGELNNEVIKKDLHKYLYGHII
jgi:hypothetical protein